MVAVVQARDVSVVAWNGIRKAGKEYKAYSVDVLEEQLRRPAVALNKGGQGKGGLQDN